MAKSKMQELAEFGQSIWLDYIDRPLLETDKLKRMIDNGLRGMTSNPSIFNSAIGSSADYDRAIRKLKNEGKTTFEIYDELTVKDIQEAADQFRMVYDATNGLDGYVSLEIDPRIAHKTEEQIKEGLRLHKKVNRPNLMVKVPSTAAGIPVIEQLTARGVNINATLIFSLRQYEQVAKAYFSGLQRRVSEGADISKIHSVASVFVSRIDTMVDKMIQKKSADGANAGQEQLSGLKGKAAVANSRIIFEQSGRLHAADPFTALKAKDANAQRVLWGSTGTKDPEYSDIKYITELIASPTVNTVPEKTLNAFLGHGEVKSAFTGGADAARGVIDVLLRNGIDVEAVCAELLDKGVVAFDDAFTELMASIEKKAATLSSVK